MKNSAFEEIKEYLKIVLIDPLGLLQHPEQIVRQKAKYLVDSFLEIDPNFKNLPLWDKFK